MDLSALLLLGLIVGPILGLVGGIAHVVWQLTHKDGYWTYGILGRRWYDPRRTRYW